jgi:hypothetical protein
MPATRLTNLASLDMIILIIFGEEYKIIQLLSKKCSAACFTSHSLINYFTH